MSHISNNSHSKINKEKLIYKPGMVEGGDYGKWICKERSITYYLEYSIIMGLFGKSESIIELEVIILKRV